METNREWSEDGAAIEETKNYILLDNGYILKKSNSTFPNNTKHNDELRKFKELGKKLGNANPSSIAHELFAAHLGKQLIAENQKIADLASLTCALNKQLYQWQAHLINAMPESAEKLLFSDPGTFISQRGDAFLIHQCKEVWDFNVIWNQTVGSTCYSFLPVILNDKRTMFLELTTRRIFNSSRRIQCHKRENYYVRDYANIYWKYDQTVGFTKSTIKGYIMHQAHIALPKIDAFNEKLLQETIVKPRSESILELLSDQEEDIEKLKDLRDIGSGSIVQGIAKEMADLFDSAVSTGENVFRSVDGGLSSVVNTTADVADDIAHDVMGIFDFTTGPISGLILYLLNFATIAYLAFDRLNRGRDRPSMVPPHRGEH